MCCGKSKMIIPTRANGRFKPLAADMFFRYVGQTSMAAVGPVTGRTYYFNGFGARLLIDRRDAPSFAGVPNLRAIRL